MMDGMDGMMNGCNGWMCMGMMLGGVLSLIALVFLVIWLLKKIRR